MSRAAVTFSDVRRAAGIKSVQYGTIAVAGGTSSNTATITAVGARAVVSFLGYSLVDDATTQRLSCITLTNATTVTATTAGNMANGVTVGFCVVDYY